MPKTIFAQKLNNNEPSGLKDKLAPGVIMMTLLDGITISLYSLQSFTADQCLNIADDIAYLHDYIYSLDENEWRGKFMSEVNAGSDVATNFTDFAKKFSETYPGKIILIYLLFLVYHIIVGKYGCYIFIFQCQNPIWMPSSRSTTRLSVNIPLEIVQLNLVLLCYLLVIVIQTICCLRRMKKVTLEVK